MNEVCHTGVALRTSAIVLALLRSGCIARLQTDQYETTLEDHCFEPQTLTGTPFSLNNEWSGFCGFWLTVSDRYATQNSDGCAE